MNNSYNNACTETLYIINCLYKEDREKIPKDFINMLKNNINKDYTVNINPNYNLKSQVLLDETKAILKQMYLEFFANDAKREYIEKKEHYRTALEENNKIGIEDLFNNIKQFDVEPYTLPTPPNNDHQTIFMKFKIWIKSLFNKDK